MRAKGEITVFLSLSLTIILSLILAIIQSTTDRAMRMRTEIAMEAGIQSVFAEYNQQLLKQYDLYFIDDSYFSNKGDVYYTKERLKDYMSYNLNPAKGQMTLFEKDLFNMSVDDVNILLFSLATDNNAAVYKRQAILAIKDRFGAAVIDNYKNNKADYDKSGIDNYDVTAKREQTRQKMHDKVDNATDEEGNKISFDDPTKKIEQQRSGIVSVILNSENISNETIDNSSLPSTRSIKSGNGIVSCKEDLNSFTNNLLFNEYLCWKFGCYTNQLNKKGIKYELEYILKNNSSDYENINAIVKDLLLLRETANAIYIFKDNTKKEEAKAVATVVAALLFSPEATDVITAAILFSWAFAESCVDVKTLLSGGKVPLIKDANSWVLSLPAALTFKAHLSDGMAKSSGLDYLMYLRLFLATKSDNDKVWRSLDLIEKNIKNTEKNAAFKIDNCIEYLDAEAKVSGRNGYKVSIRRYFGYMSMPAITL